MIEYNNFEWSDSLNIFCIVFIVIGLFVCYLWYLDKTKPRFRIEKSMRVFNKKAEFVYYIYDAENRKNIIFYRDYEDAEKHLKTLI